VAKYEFASKAWMEALHREIAEMLRGAPADLRYSFCEVFTGVPKHLDRNGTGTLAWHCRIEGSRADFAETEGDDVDMKTTADYTYLIPLARWHIDEETRAAFAKYLEDGTRDGKIVRTGNPTRFPAVLAGLHNAVIAFTE
jgi:hypothetical protein